MFLWGRTPARPSPHANATHLQLGMASARFWRQNSCIALMRLRLFKRVALVFPLILTVFGCSSSADSSAGSRPTLGSGADQGDAGGPAQVGNGAGAAGAASIAPQGGSAGQPGPAGSAGTP